MSHTTRRPLRPALLFAAVIALAGTAVAFLFVDETPAPAPAGARVAANVADADAGRSETDGAGVGRAAAQGERGCWTAPVGSRFVHHVVDRCGFELRSAEGGSQSAGALHSECDVETVVVDRRAGETLVRQQIRGLRFLGSGGQPITDDPIQASFSVAADAPVFVRLAAAGAILGFGFAEALDGDQRNFLRGTLGLFAFEAPATDTTEWTTHAVDTTGEFDARYEVVAAAGDDHVAVRRTRLHYTAISGQADLPKHELRGRGEAMFRVDIGWLCTASIDEGMTLSLALMDLQAVTQRRAEVGLVERGTVAITDDVAAAWKGANAPAGGLAEKVGGYAAGAERRRWQEKLAGVSLDHLLAGLQRVLAADPVDAEAVDAAFQQLQWMIRLDDRIAATLAEQVATRLLDVATARVALGALGAAATPAAQRTLVAVRSDASVEASLREAATITCVQIDAPSPALVESLATDADGTSALQGPSMLVLGALAPRTKSALRDGRSPIQKLLAMENDAAARGDIGTWLLAIGNAAPPETLGIVRRHIANVDASIRAAACVALRRVADADAVPILVERATTDVDVGVRRDALLELGRRRAAAARAAIEQVASNDADGDLRARARRLLGEGA